MCNGEIIKDNESGFLIEYGNIDQFVSKIEYILENKKLMEKVGNNARKTIEERFKIDYEVNSLEKICFL